ncbi:MAG: adenosylcobinamide amidohydrolase [Halococcoides sp.]
MPEIVTREAVCRIAHEGTWLVTGPLGGRESAAGAAIVTVPTDWDERDLASAARNRLDRAGFEYVPTLFTAVDVRQARAARLDGVCAIATAGLTNPAALAVDPAEPAVAADTGTGSGGDEADLDESSRPDSSDTGPDDSGAGPDLIGTESDRGGAPGRDRPGGQYRPGTVNLIVTTDRALDSGTQATLLATIVEAKTATLIDSTGFTGTTSDAVAVGCRPSGPTASFGGAATPVGDAARACVRDAVRAALAAGDDDPPDSVAAAEAGIRSERRAAVFEP